mmetsp:Transcript_4753/g.7171  ORF Transcript_4753/g.7171 Transcript_4753/m.7171 type:complete len:124 (+) Transcript_4753:2906-3277(+)
MNFTDEEQQNIGKAMSFIADYGNFSAFTIIVAAKVVFCTVQAIMLLERTEKFGHVIIMVSKMVEELSKFFATFGVIILTFMVVLRLIHKSMMTGQADIYDAFLHTFDGMFGTMRKEEFQFPQG